VPLNSSSIKWESAMRKNNPCYSIIKTFKMPTQSWSTNIAVWKETWLTSCVLEMGKLMPMTIINLMLLLPILIVLFRKLKSLKIWLLNWRVNNKQVKWLNWRNLLRNCRLKEVEMSRRFNIWRFREWTQKIYSLAMTCIKVISSSWEKERRS